MTIIELISALRKIQVSLNLENDNLRLTGNTKNIDKELLELLRERKEELIQFLKESQHNLELETISKAEEKDFYSVSNAQRRLWLLSQFEGGNKAYNITTELYLKGQIQVEKLEEAFALSIAKHESLRTVFALIDDEPVQKILPSLPFSFEFGDIQNSSNKKQVLKEEVENAKNHVFNLETGPLLRVKLVTISSDEFALLFSLHHIITDGWSIGVMVQEIMSNYKDLCTGKAPAIEENSLQYKDFTEWISKKLNNEGGTTAKKFWADKHFNEVLPLNIPGDFKRPDLNLFEGATQKFFFNTAFHQEIERLAKDNRVTLFQVYRSALSILLHKLSGLSDVIIGTPVSGRSHPMLHNQIGLYVNTLPLLSKIDPTNTFAGYLQATSLDSLESFEYQDYPLDLIIEESNIPRDTSRNPLFDVMMVLQNTAIGDGTIDLKHQHGFTLTGLDTYLYENALTERGDVSSKFDLSFNFALDSELGHFLEIEYRTKLYKKSTIQRMFNSFEFILKQVIANQTISLSAIELIDENEKKLVLTEFNQPIGHITASNILELLSPSFETNSNEIALSVGDNHFTYQDVQQNSERIAGIIQHLHGTTPNSKIGLLLDRSEHLLFSVLGIMKAGHTYVPVDITYPDDRIEYILEDSEVAFVLIDPKGAERIPASFNGKIIDVTEETYTYPYIAPESSNQNDTAYLIYTSGSTGKPKGVEISHLNALAFLTWSDTEFASTPYTCLYAATSYCFDLSVFEMFLPLIQGKRIRLLKSALEISDYVMDESGVFINTVPSVVRTLLEQDFDWKNVVALNMAGEPVPVIFKDLLDYKRIEVRNLYGPSEDTTYSTIYRFEDGQYDSVPIGTAVGYTHAYILDQSSNLLPIGVEGEICLSGLSVAKGYLNKPELTAEKFVENPFVPGQKMYRTGDLGKWMPDGKLAYIGRMDDQVKVRGYRIELGEIQYRIEQIPEVKQAVVLVNELNGEPTIIAYWSTSEAISQEAITDQLSQFLPHYMMPGCYVLMDEIPLNANGKVDKKKLPLPQSNANTECVRPENELQHHLLSIWQEILNRTDFGITDNFFELGGHSLKATRLKGIIAREIGKELTINEIFLTPTIKGQSQLIETRGLKEVQVINTTEQQEYYPLSFTQERLWVLTQFEEASKAYHMPAAFRITGNLDTERLQAALNMVVEKHEILRTVFKEVHGNPVQIVQSVEQSKVNIEEHQLTDNTPLSDALKTDWNRPFDLQNGPLLRCSILRDSSETILSFNMHHIISDGWSIGVLFSDVTKAYQLLTSKERQSLIPLEIQFKDFAIWQRQHLTDDKLTEQLNFWKNTVFKDGVTPLELPHDFHRPEVKTYSGDTLNHTFSKELTKQLTDSANRAGASLFMTLMANVSILMKKLANQSDITIGTPVAGRDTLQLQHQIGFFVNTLPIRTEVTGNLTFSELLAIKRATILKAFDYQYFPFELLVQELQPKRDLSRSPLFDVMVVLQNTDLDLKENGTTGFGNDVALEKLDLSGGITKYDLTFSFSEVANQLSLELEFNTDLYSKATIERYVGYLESVFATTSGDETVLISAIEIQSNEEQSLILSKGNRTDVTYDEQDTIVSLFEKAAIKFPENIALKVDDRSITYAELNEKSGQLARVLKEQYFVQPEDLVVLHTNRTEWMIVSILAVLKAGAAYVPIDPAYPSSRIEYILTDSQSKLMLFDGEVSEETRSLVPEGVQQVQIESVDYQGATCTVDVQPEQLAYVIYTSGTTGNPKGVLIEHRNVNRLLFNDDDLFDFNEHDVWSLFHSYCFDFSVWEMYGALLKGGKLVMVPKEIAQDSTAFFNFLNTEHITVLNQTPTAFRSLSHANHKQFDSMPLNVRYVIFGGEALMPEILEPWKKAYLSCKLINMYGITETTVHVTYKEITDNEIQSNKSLIGDPIPTLSCYVLDQDLKPVSIGVVGELCVGGAGVARGYHNRPELTAERFVDDPFNPGQKIYRSGDFARILSDGEIEYIGRKDEQVKIRGHRIEIGEIETALLKLELIDDAVVLASKNQLGEYELSAYVICENPDGLNVSELRSQLQAQLPAYMVPGYFIALNTFPLTSNGKLDKKALPAISDVASSSNEYVAPRNEIDSSLVAIWEDILTREQIGIRDNFFDLGGHSLKATRVLTRIQEEFGVKIDLKNLFIDPTIEHLSDYIDTVQWMENQENETVDQDEMIL